MLDELLGQPFTPRVIEWLVQKLGDGGANLLVRTDTHEVRCAFVLDHRIEPAGDDVLQRILEPEHPLLARYLEPQVDLFFHGTAERTDEVIGALWLEHRATCAEWIVPDAYLRLDVLGTGHGLLASGPRGVLARYASVLALHGIEPSLIGERPFQEWRNGRWQPRPRPPAALTFGRSFIVADSFSAKRR